MGVAGDIRSAEGDIDSILSPGRGIHRQIGFLASSLIDAETEVMPPQFFAGVSMEAQRQQGFLAALFHLGSDEQPVSVDHRRTGPPTRQLRRPTYVLGLAPLRGEAPAVRHSVSVWPSPPGPIGIGRRAGGLHAALEIRPAIGAAGRGLAIRDGSRKRDEHANLRMFHFNLIRCV